MFIKCPDVGLNELLRCLDASKFCDEGVLSCISAPLIPCHPAISRLFPANPAKSRVVIRSSPSRSEQIARFGASGQISDLYVWSYLVASMHVVILPFPPSLPYHTLFASTTAAHTPPASSHSKSHSLMREP
ncbi:hypothetical protein ABVK25_004437 [Lepraria finkii]|uniref:Uncharacterized protein n=1 Tax=Lepraria finkii TaxID=1340010 RepID=A0ABR4BE69_9LECA